MSPDDRIATLDGILARAKKLRGMKPDSKEIPLIKRQMDDLLASLDREDH